MYKHRMLRMLKDYGDIKRMQPVLAQQIENTRWQLEKRGDRVTSSGISRSQSLEEMKKAYDANREYLQDMDCRMTVLDEREMTVIHHFYIERTWDYIEILNEKLGVERSQIYRIKDKAMKKLCTAYFGVRK